MFPTISACGQCVFFSFCQQENPPLKLLKKSLKRNELLYSHHDPLHFIYIVSSGAIKTFQVNIHGQERIHQFYFAGEVMGFDAIHSKYYPFSAISIAKSQICQVPYPHLLEFISKHPVLYAHLLSTISQRFHFGLYVTNYSAEQRIACFLLELVKRLHVDAVEPEFALHMSRQDIGHYLGLAAETISRVLTRFQQNHILWAMHKKIKVLDMNSLQEIANKGLTEA